MGISPKKYYLLLRELTDLKKNMPKIKSIFKEFDDSDDPPVILEKILAEAKKIPYTDEFLNISRTYGMISRAEKKALEEGWDHACIDAVKEMNVKVRLVGDENIPGEGSSLFVSNHPYGIIDSAVIIGNLNSKLSERGQELKLIGMHQLKLIRGIDRIVYFVRNENGYSNLHSLREGIRYLNGGGNLFVFPSGRLSGAKVKEYPWKDGLTAYISHCRNVVPMWFSGPDHEFIYNIMSGNRKTENLRRILSFRGAWNKAGQEITLRIGAPLPSSRLMEIKDGKERIDYLRRCAETLKVVPQ